MSKKDEALRLSLEALVAAYLGKDKTGQVTEAITAIREALAEQPAQHRHISYVCPQCYWSLEEQPAPAPKVREQQEPVGHGGRPMTLRECMEAEEPTRKPWVGLTQEDWMELKCKTLGEVFIGLDVSAKLREKNEHGEKNA